MQNQDLFDFYKDGRHWEKHLTLYAERYAAFLNERRFDGLLIDVGCSTGRDVAYFSERGFQVVGIDIDDQEIETAQRTHPSCRFVQDNVEELNVCDGSIGAFYMINVIHYVDMQRALDEIYRALEPGGTLFVHFNMEIKRTTGEIDYTHSRGDIQRLVRNFTPLEQQEFTRIDSAPFEHTHTILELILQK